KSPCIPLHRRVPRLVSQHSTRGYTSLHVRRPQPNAMSFPGTSQPSYGSFHSSSPASSVHSHAASEHDTLLSHQARSTLWQRVSNFCDENFSFSLTLENRNSVARDHLANERTYLAWIRTSFSLITCGIATTQLMELNNVTARQDAIAKALGGSFVLLGMLFVLFGASRYLHTQASLTKGKFPVGRMTFAFATTSVLVALVAVMIITTVRGI
ncbi:hypothetical protein BC937DRAFT_88502, partial [Endogone sp. FLAS-F59071]